MTAACETCRFAEPTVTEEHVFMECRRFPPQLGGYDGEGEQHQGFPTVEASDWCGEWQPQPDPE